MSDYRTLKRIEWAPSLFGKRLRPRFLFDVTLGLTPRLEIAARCFLPDRMNTVFGPQLEFTFWHWWVVVGFQVCWKNAWGNLL